MNISDLVPFLQVMFAVNIAMGLWKDFIPTVMKMLRNNMVRKLDILALQYNSNLSRMTDREKEEHDSLFETKYESNESSRKEHLAQITGQGQVLGVLVAIFIAVLLLMSAFNSPQDAISQWTAYAFTIIAVLPFIVTSSRMAWSLLLHMRTVSADIYKYTTDIHGYGKIRKYANKSKGL